MQPFRGQERGADPGHPRAVRIGLSRDPRTRCLCPSDQAQHPVDVPERGRVDVAVVHLRAGLAGGTDDLLGAVHERVRHQFDEVASVGESGRAGRRGQRADLQVLVRLGTRRIPEQEPDADRAVGQVGRQPVPDRR